MGLWIYREHKNDTDSIKLCTIMNEEEISEEEWQDCVTENTFDLSREDEHVRIA